MNNGMLKWLLNSSFFQSFATREVRHIATGAAGAIAAYLATKGGDPASAANIGGAVAALILAVFGYGMSWITGKNNDTRVQVAATTGAAIDVKTAAALTKKAGNPGAAVQLAQQAVAQADTGTPQTKAALIADLLSGGPK